MKKMIPALKPQLSKADALKMLSSFDLAEYAVVVLGIRGYYKTTMGNPLENDRGIYDDAAFIISTDRYESFNAKTDPSYTRQGIAVLKPGMYLYKIGLHNMKNPYLALRQYSNVTVIRDGGKEETDSIANRFFIDIHKGGYNTTSSLGCQTIYPDQWHYFISTVQAEMNKHKQAIIPYILIEDK